LTLASFEELLGTLPSYLRPLVATLYFTGTRKGEALAVEWPQVNLDACEITLRDDQTKNSEPRVLPLLSRVVELLRRMEPKTGKVFDGTNLRTEWEAACARVGLGTRVKVDGPAGYSWHKYQGLRPHDLRRSAVRNLVTSGAPEEVAIKLAGTKRAQCLTATTS